MRHVWVALALLFGIPAASAQTVSTARVGVTPTADPEPVYVLDKHSVWNQIGTMAAGVFTPVASSATGDINLTQWNGVAVGSPTAAGVVGSGNFPNINALIAAAGLATAAAPSLTEGQRTTFSFDRSGGLRVSIPASASTNWTPDRSYSAPLAVTSISSSTPLPPSAVAGSVIKVYNRGPQQAYWTLGPPGTVATTVMAQIVPQGWDYATVKAGDTVLAGVTNLSTQTATFNVESGTGQPNGTGGPVNPAVVSSGAVSTFIETVGGLDNTSHAQFLGLSTPGIPSTGGIVGIQGCPTCSPVPVTVAAGGGGGPATIADGADVAEGAKADTAWTTGSGSVIALLKAIAGGVTAGGPSTIADGADVAEGAKADTAWVSGSGSVVALLKAVVAGVNSVVARAATIADGADVTQGAKADAAWTSGAGSEISILKAIAAGVAAGYDATANSNRVSAMPYPIGATPITASAVGTTIATTATLAGAASKTTYICGYSIRANANAVATGNATVTGGIGGTLNFTQWTAPNANGLGVSEQIFQPCIPAVAVNSGILVVSAPAGTGGVVSVTAWGFQL